MEQPLVRYDPIGFDYEIYEDLVDEDGPVENASAILFILSGIVGFVITAIFCKRRNKKFAILWALLAIGFLVLGFEEISWTQRIFNLETTESFSSNLQDQITVHNLKSVIVYLHDFLMLVGFFGAFSWLIFKRWEGTGLKYFVRIFVPSWYLMFYFIPIFIFYLIGYFMPYDHITYELGDKLLLNDQEPPELVMALGMLLFAVVSFIQQNSRIRSGKVIDKK